LPANSHLFKNTYEVESKSSIYTFDDVRVEVRAFRVLKDGNSVSLEPKAFQTLVYLIEHRNQLVGKNELLDAVWKDAFVTPNAMTRVIAQLRRVLKDDAKEARYIETVPTRGYRFVAAVEEITTDPHAIASPHAAAAPFQREQPISRSVLAGMAAILLAIAGLAFWRVAPSSSHNSEAARFLPVQFSSSTGLDVGAAFSPDGNLIVYSSDRNGSFEIYIRSFDASAKEIQLTNDGNQNLFPSFSPDGRSIAFASLRRNGIFRIPAIGGTSQRITNFGVQPIWSPDGQTIVFESNGSPSLSVTDYYFPRPSSLWTISSSGGEPKPITGPGTFEGGASSASWNPDGREIRFVRDFEGESSVWAYRIADGSYRKLIDATSFPYSNAIFSPDGRRMWFIKWQLNGDIGIWQLALDPTTLRPEGEPQPLYQSPFGVPRDLSLSRDGKRLAFTAVLSTSHILTQQIQSETTPAAEPVPLTHDVTYRYALARSSVDGKKVVYTSFPRNGIPRLWVTDADGLQPPVAVGPGDELQNFGSFSPDNNRVFYLGFENKLRPLFRAWNLADGSASTLGDVDKSADSTTPRGRGLNQLVFSPDGSKVVFHDDRDKRLQVYLQNVSSGERRVITSGPEDVGYPRFSRDGKWLSVEIPHRTGGDDIGVLPAEGGPMEVILHTNQPSFSAGWMADNDRVLFAGYRDAVWNIYSVSRSTKQIERLTNYGLARTYVRYADWLAGNRIVYEFNETKGNILVAKLP
jgi:Tol biopolymer transport system component/DNA-binding winged helix-turn-helix (wHTH) protein